jgi:hypothetical protein
MAYYKKRIAPSPNKNVAKVRRRETGNQSETRIESLHPLVERLSVEMELYDAKGNFLDKRVSSFGPKDVIALQIECSGPCGNGRVDLEGKIRDMLSKRETVSESRAKCPQTLYAGSPDVCGYEFRCHTEITYRAA